MSDEFLLDREFAVERFVGLFRGFSSYDPDAVRDPMDMRVDSDVRRIVEHTQYYFCGLDPDTRKGLQYREIIRDNPIEIPHKPFCASVDELRFVPIKIDRSNEMLDLVRIEHQHIPCLTNPREKGRSGFVYLFVRRLCREDNCNEELKRSRIVEFRPNRWKHIAHSGDNPVDLGFGFHREGSGNTDGIPAYAGMTEKIRSSSIWKIGRMSQEKIVNFGDFTGDDFFLAFSLEKSSIRVPN